MTADIEKAFLQIYIKENERNYVRFLWFDNVFAEQPTITRNRFARVIFGMNSSPFLLNGTLRKHGSSYIDMYVCMPFYVVHYHNNLMKAHHYHKSHQISSDSLEKMNIIILVFK